MRDPFTLAIVEGALLAASDEMFEAVKHASYSPIIYEVLDYATGITDTSGRLVVQGNGVTGFLGSLSSAVAAVLAKFDRYAPGDVFVVNDPYSAGGSHLSDVTVVRPFYAGERLVGFGASKAHWNEIGGAKPGSWSNEAGDVFAEGFRFPLMRIAEAGVLNETILTLLAANVRTPVQTLGDLHAQLGALHVGERRIADVAERYGADAVEAAMDAIVSRGRKAAARMLTTLPKGVFEAEDYLDTDGKTDRPVYVRVKLTITDERFVADFTGSSPSVASTINATWESLLCGVRTTFRALIDSDEPTSDGMFELLDVICPLGTVFTAQAPTPVSTYWESSDMAADLVQKALAPHMNGQLPAGHSLSVCASILAFDLQPGDDNQLISVEPMGGGWGGSEGRDGEGALVPIGDGDTCSIPVEVLEATFPVLVHQYALNTEETGGAGQYRGGYGLVRTLEMLRPATLTASFGRNKFPAWGFAGGTDGTPNRIEVTAPNGEPVGSSGRYEGLPLPIGTVVSFVTGVGGGYGDPSKRDAAAVERDIRNGNLTLETAKNVYGYEGASVKGALQ